MIITQTVCFLGKIFIKPFIQKNINSNPKKILVIKSGAIGDVLMTTPFVRTLRKQFPKSIIHYLTSKESSKVLEGNLNLSSVISVDSKCFTSFNIVHKLHLFNKIRNEKYDCCFILDKSWLANTFIFLTKVPIRVGFDRYGEGFSNNMNVSYDEIKHEIYYYLDLAYLFGAEKEEENSLDLYLRKEDIKFAEDFLTKNKIKDVVGIAPGGGKNPGIGIDNARIWSEEKFINLVTLLGDHKIILFGGPNDVDLCNRLVNRSQSNIINLSGKTTIKETAALMQKCSCVITNDAGPMHIASSVNDRVVSIFGPTHPLRKAPLNKKSVWLWKDEDKYDPRVDVYSTKYAINKKFMDGISARDVYDVVMKEIK